MNQTNKQKEEETLVLLDIAKAIDEVRAEGFGSVTVFVQDTHIYRWEIVKSRTKSRTKTSNVERIKP